MWKSKTKKLSKSRGSALQSLKGTGGQQQSMPANQKNLNQPDQMIRSGLQEIPRKMTPSDADDSRPWPNSNRNKEETEDKEGAGCSNIINALKTTSMDSDTLGKYITRNDL